MDSGDLLQSTVMVSGSTGVSAAAWAEASLAESFTSLAAEIFFSVLVVFFLASADSVAVTMSLDSLDSIFGSAPLLPFASVAVSDAALSSVLVLASLSVFVTTLTGFTSRSVPSGTQISPLFAGWVMLI